MSENDLFELLDTISVVLFVLAVTVFLVVEYDLY